MAMGEHLELLEPRNLEEWRAWLEENAESAESVWLAIGKKGGTVTSLTYEQAVEEALCFGWIDSTVRRLDDHRFQQLFARRKRSSNWSRLNKERAARLIEEGRMRMAGLAAIEAAKANGSWEALDQIEAMVVPEDFAAALAANPQALANFEGFSPSARKMFLAWIGGVKSPAKRAERIAAAVRRCAEGRRLTD